MIIIRDKSLEKRDKGIVLAFALWIALPSIACDLLTSY
jgi:hypothetical protein